MKNSKNFLEFVRENQPAFLPGDFYYYLNCYGEITESDKKIKEIILDENWNWRITNRNDNKSNINSVSGYYPSINDAVVARNASKVKFIVLEQAHKGSYVLNGNLNQEYRVSDTGILDVSHLKEKESFITAMEQQYKNLLRAGVAVTFEINSYDAGNDALLVEADNHYTLVSYEPICMAIIGSFK